MSDLFDINLERDLKQNAPLADRMRPRSFDEFVGQEEAVGAGTILRQAVENDELFSIIFWGPPGSGKTTLAAIVARLTKSAFERLSGVDSGKDDLRRVIKEARDNRKLHARRTILFIDEIHRWNKAQQDALLPHVEQGIVILIGATTENPSFEVISPLLSRCRVIVLKRLEPEHLEGIVQRALRDKERGYGNMSGVAPHQEGAGQAGSPPAPSLSPFDSAQGDPERVPRLSLGTVSSSRTVEWVEGRAGGSANRRVTVEPKAMRLLTTVANGDARTALNALEISVKATKSDAKGVRVITLKTVAEALQHRALLYDKKGEEHYNIISAFIKSLRGSNPDAALYYLGRMLEAGEDPLFIARRMVILASEDIGMADSRALPLAVACMQACDLIGMPECQINLSHVAVYLATAQKSNATYVAYGKALGDVKETLNEPVPLNLRNAPTDLMKELGYGKGYKYSHHYEAESADGEQQYLPDKLVGKKYFEDPSKKRKKQ